MTKRLKDRWKAYRRLTPSEEEGVKRCYERGEPLKDIARRFDVSMSTVTRVAVHHNLARRGNIAYKRVLAAIRKHNIEKRKPGGGG